MNDVIEINNLRYRYAKTTKDVLSGLNAKFECGKLYCIMGKSGTGKSTLLSLLSGLDTCTDGEILFEGKNITHIDRDEYRAKHIGVIFQSYNLLQNATALENIMLAMNISGSEKRDKKQYAYSLLQQVGIDREKAERKILQLSGGEQQRVGIARALSHDPRVIIADEPTGNLDGDTEENIMKIFLDLASEEKRCVILVTHSNQVANYADEVLYLWNGTLNITQ